MNHRSLILIVIFFHCHIHKSDEFVTGRQQHRFKILPSTTCNSSLSSKKAASDDEITITNQTPPFSSNNNDNNKTKFSGTINPLRLAVLKLGFTEPRFTSPLNYETRAGIYKCANCKSTLFDSTGKYDSKSGWPSFWKTATTDIDDDNDGRGVENRITLTREWDGRIECSCSTCGGHLGHVFPDGPDKSDVDEMDHRRIYRQNLAVCHDIVLMEHRFNLRRRMAKIECC